MSNSTNDNLPVVTDDRDKNAELRAEIEATDSVIRGLLEENKRLRTELALRDEGEPFKPFALKRLRDEVKQLRVASQTAAPHVHPTIYVVFGIDYEDRECLAVTTDFDVAWLVYERDSSTVWKSIQAWVANEEVRSADRRFDGKLLWREATR